MEGDNNNNNSNESGENKLNAPPAEDKQNGENHKHRRKSRERDKERDEKSRIPIYQVLDAAAAFVVYIRRFISILSPFHIFIFLYFVMFSCNRYFVFALQYFFHYCMLFCCRVYGKKNNENEKREET